ncbi:hypothetical protein SCHPADRAFT_932918 [Schizopora paradoxa]|uniref:F-box domain-containing protein n=1 Tax=Schizopora paradoxa TaxID=27342 RepID=A0A0H2R4D5_9AGAM|nr:hypothetical protein SCHPADRAFT_932918 [Schizopora paradoxa]
MHDCEREDLDPEAVNTLAEIVERLRQTSSGGCLGAQDEWLRTSILPPSSLLEYNPKRAEEDRNAADRLTSVAKSLRTTVDALFPLLQLISLQALTCESAATSMRLRAGLLTLPDEVLLHIMEDIAFDEGDDPYSAVHTVRAALKLSAVCRRFRDLAMRSSLFWYRVSNNMHIDLVKALCGRLTKPIGVVILMGPIRRTEDHVAPFMQAVAARSEFWTRFVQGSEIMPSLFSGLTREDLQDVAQETRGLDAPFLREISMHYPDFDISGEVVEAHYYKSWVAPQLRTFKTTNLVPVPFASGSSLTSVTVKLDFSTADWAGRVTESLGSLIDFLVSCPKVKSLRLGLSNLKSPSVIPARLRTDFSGVEDLELDFSHCDGPETKSFLHLIHFPNTPSLKLHLAKFDRTTADTSTELILQEVASFAPCITQLTLFFFFHEKHNRIKHLTLPNFPRIQQLTLMTSESRLNISPQQGLFCTSLRTLTFCGCDFLDREWVSILLHRFKQQGNVPHLEVQNCQWKREDEDTWSWPSTPSEAEVEVEEDVELEPEPEDPVNEHNIMDTDDSDTRSNGSANSVSQSFIDAIIKGPTRAEVTVEDLLYVIR